MELKVEYLKLDELKPYEDNARKHGDLDVSTIIQSIKEFGFNDPIGIWKDNVIVEGHGRLIAAKKLGMLTVPCVRLDHLTDEQRKAYALAHNKTAEMSDWDMTALEEELKKIEDIDMSQFGFDMSEFEEEGDVAEDDFDEEQEIEPRSKTGQIYKLGAHRLMVGDSTKPEDVAKLMNGVLADLVVTDPPYNVAYEGKTADALTIQNDSMSSEDFLNFLTAAFTNLHDFLKPGGAYYVWHAASESLNFLKALGNANLPMHEQIIWAKNIFVMGRQDYQWKHEPCWYGWKEGAAHYFVDDRTQSTVINEDKPRRADIHPTMKPINLFATLIKNSSKKGEIVLDLFGGSGTTMMACEQLGRVAYLMEFDPKYADAIIARYEEFTGNKAELVEE